MQAKYIKAEMRHDHIPMYAASMSLIPYVTKSDHPRFSVGTRLDWGFVQIAIQDGYTVTIKPYKGDE